MSLANMVPKCKNRRKKGRHGGSGPGHTAVDPLQKLGDYSGHTGLGSLLGRPPGSIVPESFEDPGEREVGSEAVHSPEDEVANQVDNTLSLHL
jgi:hypothetical protein